MLRNKRIAKWGFGMAPISARMRRRYDTAVQAALDFLDGNMEPQDVDLALLSELKGMFNRCIRQDQWDWFSVFVELGQPKGVGMRRIVALITELRRSVLSESFEFAKQMRDKFIEANLTTYLLTYQQAIEDLPADAEAGWIYVLSTREEPDILKIGMTQRTVAYRVREINSATGVLIPYSARRVFRVKSASQTEREIFTLLSEFRVRPDREFFELPYRQAVKLIEDYIETQRRRDRCRGTVKWYDREKCYGFVSVGESTDVLIHSSQVPKIDVGKLQQGVVVAFDLGYRPQGACALNVELISREETQEGC